MAWAGRKTKHLVILGWLTSPETAPVTIIKQLPSQDCIANVCIPWAPKTWKLGNGPVIPEPDLPILHFRIRGKITAALNGSSKFDFSAGLFSSEVLAFQSYCPRHLVIGRVSVWQASLGLQSWKMAKLEDLLFTCFGCRDFGCASSNFRNGAEPGQSRILIILCN